MQSGGTIIDNYSFIRDFVRNTRDRWVWTLAIVGSQTWLILQINASLLIENDHSLSDL